MAFVKPNPEEMREEFHNLVARRDAQMALAGPKRAAYEAKRNEIMKIEQNELKPLEEAMRRAEDPLFQLNNDIAEMSRWLKGRTGARPDGEVEA